MHNDLERNLLTKYPAIFGENPSEPDSGMRWGIECGDGWHNLLDKLCHDIQAYIEMEGIPQITFTQVKEKFGELRIYYTSIDQHIDNLIAEAATFSRSVCENCGTSGALRKTRYGWIKPLCSECVKQYNTD